MTIEEQNKFASRLSASNIISTIRSHFKYYGVEYTEQLIERTYKEGSLLKNKLMYYYVGLVRGDF